MRKTVLKGALRLFSASRFEPFKDRFEPPFGAVFSCPPLTLHNPLQTPKNERERGLNDLSEKRWRIGFALRIRIDTAFVKIVLKIY